MAVRNANCHIIIQENKGFLKPKPRHEWQVVAEALHISGTEIVAAGLATAIGLIVFQEEGSIEDDAFHESIGHRWRSEDVVERSPLALKAIGASRPIATLRLLRHFREPRFLEISDALVAAIVVEVACDKDICIRRKHVERVDGSRQPVSHLHAMRARQHFPTRPAGRMNDEDMQRVARGKEPGDIEDVACGMHVFQWFHV